MNSSLRRASLVALPVLAAFAWLAVVVAGRPAAPQPAAFDVKALEKLALEELASSHTPGAAIAVVQGDRVVYAKGLGVASVEQPAPVTADTLFRLGSTTKMMTAAALLTLVVKGAVKLDAPLRTYVPGLAPRIGAVTAQQLLTHTSGLRDEAPMFGLHDDAALGVSVRGLGDQMFFAEPGRVFSYANPGYWTAGFLLECASGKPYADAMQAALFEPLGMSRTTLRPTMAMTYPLAQGHEGQEPPRVIRPAADNAGTWPAGSVFSSVRDLSRFVIALLHGGQIEGRQALPAGVISKMTAGYVDVPGDGEMQYGFGLDVGRFRGVRLWEHGGARSGFGSTIRMAPAQRVGVIIVANRTGSSLPRTALKALEMLLPLEKETAKPTPEALAMPPADLERYAGRYSQTDKPSFEIRVQDGRLLMVQGTERSPLVKVGERQIQVRRASGPSPILFVTFGADGRVEFIHLGTRAVRRLPTS